MEKATEVIMKKDKLRFFIYCSPHYYYIENLLPVAKRLEAIGHEVHFCSEDVKEKKTQHIGTMDVDAFLKTRKKFDAVILTQCWCLKDKSIAERCAKRNIPFYIFEHAPQMLFYDAGKAKYRGSINGARAHFMWGKASAEVMKTSGCKENLPIIGSPRLEIIKNITRGHSKIVSEYGKRYIAVYTTSDRMMPKDFPVNLKLIKHYADKNGYNLYLKNHVKYTKRPRGIKRYTHGKALEFQFLAQASKVFFAFPSSVMIPAAWLDKDVYTLFGNHENEKVKKYAKDHAHIFPVFRPNLERLMRVQPAHLDKYGWLRRNIETENDPVEESIKYILNDVKSLKKAK